MNLGPLILKLDTDADAFNAKIDRAVARVQSAAGAMSRAMRSFALDNQVTRLFGDLGHGVRAWGDVARDTFRDFGRWIAPLATQVRAFTSAAKNSFVDLFTKDIPHRAGQALAAVLSTRAGMGVAVLGLAAFRRGRDAVGWLTDNVISGVNALKNSAAGRAFGAVFSATGAIGQHIAGGVASALAAAPRFLGRAALAGGRAAGSMLGTLGSAGLGAAQSVIGGGLSFGLNLAAGAARMATMGILGLSVAAGAAAVAAVRMATDYERSAIAFEVMTGSAERGKRLLDDITRMAIETPFKASELIGTARLLKAYGVDTEQIIPPLKVLGDVAAGTGSQIDRIALAFGQVRAAGRLFGTELRQFTEAGVPVIEALAETMGQPTNMIRLMVQEGQVGFPQVVAAFNHMTAQGGRFGGMMERLQGTVAGRWNAFLENIQVGLRNLGLSFFEGFGLAGLLNQWSKFTEGLQGKSGELTAFFGRVREGFDLVSSAGGVALGMLRDVLGDFITKMTGAAPSWGDFRTAAKQAIEAVIEGMARLVNMIKDVVGGIATMVQAAGEAMRVAGLGKEAGSRPTSVYEVMRKEGYNKVASGLGSWGGWVVEQVTGENALDPFVKQGRADPAGRNPMQAAVDALRQFAGGKIDPAAVRAQARAAMDAVGQGGAAGGFAGRLGGLGGAASGVMKNAAGMATALQAASDGMKFMERAAKEFYQNGATPFEHALKDINNLAAAQRGGLPVGAEGAIGAPLAFGQIAAKGLMRGPLAEFAAGQILDRLRSAVGKHDVLPGFHPAGSVEAQNTINRSYQAKTTSIQEEIKGLIEQLKIQNDERMRINKEALDALNEIKRNAVVPAKIG